ncbi:hypothetical protein CYY_004758 [Polysphondylium violaceum]|uniref:FNIP repeat-containing protein n=1 Tax=Polysphondylium violaceum TaxID=133409 RepID=A0A8J4V7G2_9MYCE|nr:hypothetical protein CYY_004758 [Polysphondylium violaceum]
MSAIVFTTNRDGSEIDRLFYSVYRNKFLQSSIRTKVLQNTVIEVDLDYVDKNYKYFDILSSEQKLENGIFIKVKIHDQRYFSCVGKHVINHLVIHRSHNYCQDTGLKVLPEGVVKVDFHNLKDAIHDEYQLPQSLTHLTFSDSYDFQTSAFVDNLLSALPPNVRYLSLPSDMFIYDPKLPFVLPEALVDFKYETKYINVGKLVLPKGKQYKDYKIGIWTPEQLHFLRDQTWIVNVLIQKVPQVLSERLIPSHIRVLELNFEPYWEAIPLEKDQLPEGLQELRMRYYRGHINTNVLPVGLKILMMSFYNQDIDDDILPEGLEHLQVTYTSRNGFTIGTLPSSLTKFYTNLATGLKSLPSSLTNLQLINYSQSFDSFNMLDNLTKLSIYQFTKSVAIALTNVIELEIDFQHLDKDATLSHTQIRKLNIKIEWYPSRVSIDSDFLPKTITKLITRGIDFSSSGTIPDGCVYLATDIKDLDARFIPSSVRVVKTLT